ncbi:unnamed protein product [Fraxinus pennsylvanica]|uniref:ArsA/GET3 Anion-transporting ATPase-like domain-containing protein n=1 Tax=Fraxinus pennsylvanica TaxID=56036 RepID=A0AAD1ZGE2_9LAMI|nr:unnamed protein product [Fraxinus pennsylvanica]
MLVSKLTPLLDKSLAINPAKQIHAQILINGFSDLEPQLIGRILGSANHYSRKTTDYVKLIIHRMQNPDVFSMACTIRFLSQHGQFQEAVAMYLHLHSSGLSPNTFAISSGLKACARILCNVGVMIHGQVHKYGFCNVVYVQTALVDFYSKMGHMDTARRVFDEIHGKNVVSWNSMLAGNMEQGYALFRQMPERNSASWNAMICGYLDCGKIELARSFFDAMPQKNNVSYITMISGFSSSKPMAIVGNHCFYAYSLKSHVSPFWNFSPSFSSKLSSLSIARKKPRPCLQVRSVAAPTEAIAGFDEMVSGTQRKYYMLGGKGGVGKTSCAASLAVKFANNGHPTLVVSTDPAHSLSDSFAQDLTGGTLVPVEGPYSPLFALEINPEKAREEFRSVSQNNGGSGVKDFMDGMGLGMLAEQLGELKLGELLDTPPPGLDEAIAISKVMQFLESQEYNTFTRIVFDTAPTGHTLRLLSLPDFLDASIGKILKLKQKISSATSAIKSVFGQEENRQNAADKLEKLRERMLKVRELFRDTNSTEFIIVTIPTVMAISESSRLCASLKKESVPVNRLVVNQILPPSASDCKFCAMKRKDQTRAISMIESDPELSSLTMIQAPLVDVEIRVVQVTGDKNLRGWP